MPRYYAVESINGAYEKGKEHFDTVYHRLNNFNLVNQLGQPVSRENLAGKVTLVTFFPTTDSLQASYMSAILKKIENTYERSDSGFHILTFTTNPRHDSVNVLKNYADNLQVDHDVWWFLTGEKAKIVNMAKTDFEVNLQKADSSDTSLYSPQFILMGKRQYVRGYYNAFDSSQVRQCVRDISMLMLEKVKDE
ncbi:MAG: SCO family protein [Chitinophagaceae bacterium]|nr:MAG: SCO family protein [Chitinophagaceae bacterium]